MFTYRYGINSVDMGVCMQVYRVGWFGRAILEGYGYTQLPTGLHGQAGTVKSTVQIWKPIGMYND